MIAARIFRSAALPAALLASSALFAGLAGPSVSATVPADQVAARDQRIRELESRVEQERQAREQREADIGRLTAEIRRLHDAAARADTSDKTAEYIRQIERLQKDLRALSAAQPHPAPPAPPPAALLPADVNRALRDIAQKNGLVFDESQAMLRVPGDLLFASGSDRITDGGTGLLKKLNAVLERPEIRDCRIRVVGHTDKRPIVHAETAAKYPTNLHLSTARAVSVVAELIQMGKSSAKDPVAVAELKRRFEAVGRGQWDLLDAGDGDAAHRKNRRVEVFLVPPARGLASAESAASHRK